VIARRRKPSLDLTKLSQYFRNSTIAFFLQRKLLNERLAKNMLDWTHSGFSVDLSVKIGATSSKAREALSQYIPRPAAGRRPARGARPPVSLKKLLVEDHAGSVLYHTKYIPYFRTNRRAGHCTASKLFSTTDFLAKVLQHLPDPGIRLIPGAAALARQVAGGS